MSDLVSMAVDLGGIAMRNPVCTASGTFGIGRQFEGFFDVGATLGAVTCKGVSSGPWEGNPAPRMAKLPSAIMNSVGLQNPGVREFVRDSGDYLQGLSDRGCQVICQVVGHTVDECAQALELLDELAPFAAGFELNVSCPNVERGGAALGATPAAVAEVTGACRRRTDRPLLVKLAPHDVAESARAAEAAGADALTLINTVPGMAIDVTSRRPRTARPIAGVSGPAIHAIAVRMVWEAAHAVGIPINGVGGITCWADAAEMILAGATAVSVGTANLYDPMTSARIVGELEEWVATQGASDVSDLIGAVEC